MSIIHTFLTQARERGLNDEEIIQKLQASGWDETKAKGLLHGDDLVAPSPAEANNPDATLVQPAQSPIVAGQPSHNDKQPVAVVQRYTTRGLEYGIQFLALGIGAISLGILLHDLANRTLDPTYSSGDWGAMAGAAAVVAMPIFTVLFLRLKRAERSTPLLRQDSSRRKWVQLSLLVSFLWGLWAVTRYLYDLFLGNTFSTPSCSLYTTEPCPEPITGSVYTALQLLHLLITFAIAGGIFAYYWIDEHRKDLS